MAGYSDLLRSGGARPFITDESRTYTFEEMLDLGRQRAARIEAGKGDVVAVRPDNTVDSVVDCLAVWERGAVLQLVNGRLTAAEVAPQLQVTGAIPFFDPGVAVGGQTPTKPVDGALIVATSGTGGRARLVVLSWDNLLASAEASRLHLCHEATDRWLAVLPLFHVGGFSILLRSLYVGGEVVLRTAFDAVRCAADLHTVTLASLVGAMLPPILAADTGPYEGLRAVLVGGGPTGPVLEQAAAAGIPVLSTYGMTETASQIATAPLGDGPRRRVVAVPGAEIRTDGRGEIEVRGPMVSQSYVGGPWRGADDWFKTGDIGTIDEAGFLRVHGRMSDVVITGGENVMPAEVESALEAIVGVEDVAVFGIPDDEWGEVVAAAVVGDVEPEVLGEALRSGLAGYKVPRRWIKVGALPRNALGKVDRRRLRAMMEATDGG